MSSPGEYLLDAQNKRLHIKAIGEDIAAKAPQKFSGHPRFYKILQEVLAPLHSRKAEAYEGSGAHYANYKDSGQWFTTNDGAVRYALMRLQEKLKRVRNLLDGAKPGDESVLDSLDDIAIIAVIARILYEEINV